MGHRSLTAEPTLRTVDVAALTARDEERLIELVARTFPGEPSLVGRWYHDTRPTLVILAEHQDALVGVRIVSERDVRVGGRALRIAGFGIGVAPEWQRRGVGTALTQRALDVVSERGCDVALAFLFSDNAAPLLRAHGFAPLRARVGYTDRHSGARVDEAAPAFARDVRPGGVALIESAGALDLGVGTW